MQCQQVFYDRARTPILPGQIEYDNEDGYYNLGSWEGNPIDSFASMITGIHVKKCYYLR